MKPSLLPLLFLSLCACATVPASTTTPQLPERPILRAVDDWDAAVAIRHRVTIRWQGQEQSFEAVLQRTPGELRLVGLGPMNSVGFLIRYRDEVEFENRTDRALPFQPEHILADVQRVFYPWVTATRCETSPCERQGTWHDVNIREIHTNSYLRERRFRWTAAPTQDGVDVHYSDWTEFEGFPSRVELENQRFGYTLILDLLEVTNLEEVTAVDET